MTAFLIFLAAAALAGLVGTAAGRRERRIALEPGRCSCGHNVCYHGGGKCHEGACMCQRLTLVDKQGTIVVMAGANERLVHRSAEQLEYELPDMRVLGDGQ